MPAEQVIDELVAGADPGIVASAGPRYFGFVTGGALPAALAADWLAAAWDQNAHMWVGSPAASIVEEVVEDWVLSLLGLPMDASVGLVTGCQMANVTCLAVARDSVLKQAGWDVASQGLIGAPPLTVIAGAEAHATIFSALRLLGLGRDCAHLVAADDQGRMDPEALARELARRRPGDRLRAGRATSTAAPSTRWSRSSTCASSPARGCTSTAPSACGRPPRRQYRHLVRGVERADSWATDGHKWLNVPYDCGLAIVKDRAAHRRAMSLTAAYLVAGEQRDNYDLTPEASRRARGFPLYAALRSLGRRGLAELIERNCAQARRFAELPRAGGAEILNDVVLNQVLVAAPPERGRAHPGRRHVLGRRHGLARPRGDPHLVLELGDDRRRRGAICAGDPRRAQGLVARTASIEEGEQFGRTETVEDRAPISVGTGPSRTPSRGRAGASARRGHSMSQDDDE